MRRLLVILCSVLVTLTVKAQEQVEYLMEIGGGLGLNYYFGDATDVPFAHSSIMASAVFRRNFNARMALKANLAYGHYSGNSTKYYFPDGEGGELPPIHFNGDIVDLGAQFEFNFWGYGIGPSYKGLSRITPYAVGGIGFTLAMTQAGVRVGPNFPIGVGVKYKLKPRLNIGLEWTYRFTTIDSLDGIELDDPFHLENKFLKNKDGYSFFMLFLTYDFGPKYRKCNN